MKLHHVLALAACISSAAASTVRQLEGSTAGSSANANTGTTAGGTSTTNGDLKVISYPNDKYHMPAVRVVHARVQSDAPIAVEGTLVSSFGDGDRDAGYLSALDTVNTASVEGALMYVQAEGINVNSRAAEERCERKNGMAYIVFYEVLVSQTNETIAQFQDDWETPEYGPMIPMDSGRCTPLKGSDSSNVPVECLQFNGVDGQPNLGPFVGGGTKNDDVRAPYPDTYWFSFPNTCPTEAWGDKTDECRASTRQGLCDFGYAPNGVDCTFAYTILGWVPIDDVVGITKIENNATGELFANFTEWCEASEDNVEFSANSATGEFESGLPFWEDPLDSEANAKRATAVLEAYAALLENGSSQVDPEVLADFQKLPTVEELAAVNPPCYETVATCGDAPGCKRVGYSQICTKCEEGENCPVNDGSFTFPDLAKAPTNLSDNETTTDKGLLDSAGTSKGGSSSGSGSAGSSGSGSNGAVSVTLSVAVAALGAALGVAIGM